MARFSDLPNEITLMIISLVLPDDIENIASTCRNIYDLAERHLERHRALKRRHAVYLFNDPRPTSPQRTHLPLLDEYLQESRTVYYVQKLSVNRWLTQWTRRWNLASTAPEELHLAYSDEYMSKLRETVSRLAPQDEVPEWLGYLESGSEDPIVALLLLLFPNLSTLKMNFTEAGHKCVYGTTCRIARMMRPGLLLSQLRHIYIICWPLRYNTVPFKLLEFFASLPSMRSLYGQMLLVLDPDGDPDTEMAPQTSNVEDLRLTACLFHTKRLFKLFKAFKALRSFTYVSEPTTYEIPRTDFDPWWITLVLSSFAKLTLESLTLVSERSERKFMGDIRGFEAVRNLSTESQLLLRESDLHYDETSLAKALPPNLETLKLKCDGVGDESEIPKLIRALPRLKMEFVPALKQVEIFTRNGSKDFDTIPDDTVPAASSSAKPHHTYEALVGACKLQGFDLLVRPLSEREIDVLLGVDSEGEFVWADDSSPLTQRHDGAR